MKTQWGGARTNKVALVLDYVAVLVVRVITRTNELIRVEEVHVSQLTSAPEESSP
jgi:hypothetical protein